ncbi:hypothetical protein [Hymenobacter metallilatus]|uniref:Uncharacterized protein n=1 Tax=Hymenobacter metallilatus TaxID=2493666 RepID=A0A428IYH8_9BACT|nr:hypothetical protein [Hymenobacter metallilatus]RSK24188.1 hypothetical protein EI290_20625 [Hymenobacter metallilatus]
MLPVLATSTAVSTLASSRVMRYLLTGGFFLAVAGGAFLLFRKILQTMQRDKAIKDVGANSADGLALAFASRCYAAMNSGHEWWNDWFGDGTDEEALYQVARDMRSNNVPFVLVANKYKALYTRDLYADLTAELATDEMAQFQAALSTGLGNVLDPGLLVTQQLITTAPSTILDDKLEPVSQTGPRTRLGPHDETMMLPGGRVLHGFLYQNQRRYVAAPTVQLVPLI